MLAGQVYSSEGEQGQGPEWGPGLRDPSWRLAGTEDGALLAGVWVTALGLLDIVVVIAVDIPASAPYVLARLERQPTQKIWTEIPGHSGQIFSSANLSSSDRELRREKNETHLTSAATMGAKGSKEGAGLTDEERRRDMLACFEKFAKAGGFREKVKHLTTQEIASLDPKTYVLVDVRPDKLRKVSHIPGSITQAEFEQERDGNAGAYDGKTVITSWYVHKTRTQYARPSFLILTPLFSFVAARLGTSQAFLPRSSRPSVPVSRFETTSGVSWTGATRGKTWWTRKAKKQKRSTGLGKTLCATFHTTKGLSLCWIVQPGQPGPTLLIQKVQEVLNPMTSSTTATRPSSGLALIFPFATRPRASARAHAPSSQTSNPGPPLSSRTARPVSRRSKKNLKPCGQPPSPLSLASPARSVTPASCRCTQSKSSRNASPPRTF